MADLNILVGDGASSWEDLVVEIRVVVDEPTHALGLIRRLARLFGRTAVTFDSSRREIMVSSEWESRGVVHVIDAVEAWLAEDGADSATLSIGDRSYTMAGSSPLGAGR